MFLNEKQNDRQPDYRGTIMIAGKTYEIAAWKKTSRNGSEFLSLQASEPRERAAAPQPAQHIQQPQAPMPDYVPDYAREESLRVEEFEDLPF